MDEENTKTKENIICWNALHSFCGEILIGAQKYWQQLLENEQLHEGKYQDFLSDHASFLANERNPIVISKLKLSSDFEPDFVVASDKASFGFEYNLIEIQKLHDKPYNQDGTPNKALTTAIQQVQNWRQWVEFNPCQAKDLFCSSRFMIHNDPCFS